MSITSKKQKRTKCPHNFNAIKMIRKTRHCCHIKSKTQAQKKSFARYILKIILKHNTFVASCFSSLYYLVNWRKLKGYQDMERFICLSSKTCNSSPNETNEKFPDTVL